MASQKPLSKEQFPDNLSYAIPDPEWDYADEWHALNQAKIRIDRLLAEMSEKEFKDHEFDKKLASAFAKFQREIAQLLYFEVKPVDPNNHPSIV
jgi:hypothetical protein